MTSNGADSQENVSERTSPVGRGWAVLAALSLAAILAAGAAVYATRTVAGLDVVGLALAGTAAAAGSVVGGDDAAYIAALKWDFVLIGGYLIAFVGWCLLGVHVFVTRRWQQAAQLGVGVALLAAGCDAAENALLLGALHGVASGGAVAEWALPWAAGAAALKFAFLVPAAGMAALSASSTLVRALRPRGGVLRLINSLVPGLLPPPVPNDGEIVAPPPVTAAGGETWPSSPTGIPGMADAPHARWRYGRRLPPRRQQHPADIGICVSGGGIRSGCVALGALQSMQRAGRLREADYLVSVSGGGYTAGAIQLALHDSGDGAVPESSEVFAAGSVEEDHVRRHGRYIAEGPREWIGALGALLRGVLASLALLAGVVVAAGLAAGWFYRTFPVVALAGRGPFGAAEAGQVVSPQVSGAVWDVLVATATVAALLWLAALLTRNVAGHRPGIAPWLRPAVLLRAVVAVAAWFAFLWLLVPVVVWVSALALYRIPVEAPASAASGTAVFSVLLAYAGALAGALWRGRKRIGTLMGQARSLFRRAAAVQPPGDAKSPVQYLIVWTVLILLSAASLLVFGWVAATGPRWGIGWQLGIPLALGLVAVLVDQTWFSLHPFYRRRLASAFAVRRRVLPRGDVCARPYDYDEQTPLSTYGEPEPGFPQVIFAAAANLSGTERTPPGRRAASITFSSDYVGGPDVGWVDTAFLRRQAGLHLGGDLTVQAAMAISGAAFASAMGRHARVFQTLFALSNARLGAWLPNPAYLGELQRYPDDWRRPLLPAIRRLPYFLRELAGSFPYDDRLLFCTDGGHYDNLGLVELLRHRPRLVYCFDASAGAPPFARTLAEAVTLAHEELGYTVTLRNPFDLIPGSAEPLAPQDPLAAVKIGRAHV